MRQELKNGTLLCSNDYVVLWNTFNKNTTHAGVVVPRQANVCRFVFGSTRPVQEMTAEEEAEILRLCAKKDIPAKRLLEQCVPPEVDENGNLCNPEAFKESPQYGIFSVPVVEDEDNLVHGVGIILKEGM